MMAARSAFPARHIFCDNKDTRFRLRQMMKKTLITAFALLALSVPGMAEPVSNGRPDSAAVEKLHNGIADCVGCNLQNADLINTCVKAHDLHGANSDGANATLMCLSYGNYRNATFRNTNLNAANLGWAKMDGADMTGATTTITSFLGTDLRKVKGLT